MKNIIFISDLHLGAGESNDFHRSHQLHRLLDYAEENADELVILGDFLELLQCEFYPIYIQHYEIFQHLFRLAKKIPIRFVVGNHDAVSAVDCELHGKPHFFGSKVSVLPEYENRELQIFAAHGHQYSLFNSHQDILDVSEVPPGDQIAKVVGWMERNFHSKIDVLLEKIYIKYKLLLRWISGGSKKFANLVTPAHPDYRRLGGDFTEFEEGATDILRSPRYSLCIFGHTHQPKIERLPDGIYANTGSWVGDDLIEDPPTFIEVNDHFVRLIDAQSFEILDSMARKKLTRSTRKRKHYLISKPQNAKMVG